MKKMRLLIIAAAAVLLLALAYVLVTREPKVPEPDKLPETEAVAEDEAAPEVVEEEVAPIYQLISLIDLDINNLETIEVNRIGGDHYTLLPFGEGTFKVADTPGVSLMTSAAQSIRFSLILFTSNTIVSEGENSI